jgi:ADP-ribosylglycohydrolase
VEGKRGAAGAVARAAAAVAAGQNSSDVGPGDAVDDDAASEYEWRSGGEVWRGTLCDRVEQTALPAAGSQLSVLEAAESWGSGGYLLETVPCVLHVLAAHASEPEEALVRAVNDTADNDTIAAVTGSALGALHGSGWLPSRWLDALLGRTVEDDDGRVQSLAEQVATRFALRRGMVDA